MTFLFLSVLSVSVSGGRPIVFVLWAGHFGRSLLDSHGAQREKESSHRCNTSLSNGCPLCLYPLIHCTHWACAIFAVSPSYHLYAVTYFQ